MARFLGVTTIVLDDGETGIMTDGFFSRPGLLTTLFGGLSPDESRIAFALSRASVGKIDAVLVAHSHYDHAMDAATVAYRTGALLIGSESTANIGLGQGFPKGRIHVISRDETFQFGKFRVTPTRSPHSPDAWFLGSIEEPLHPPERHVSAFKEGGNYSFLVEHVGLRALIHPSANFYPGMFRNVKTDVVFLGIGQLGKQSWCFAEEYWREVVMETGANLVIPIHWDNFFLSLDRPLEAMPWPLDDFGRGKEMVLRLAERSSVAVRFMPLFDRIDLASVAQREIGGRAEAARRTLARSPECVGRSIVGQGVGH